MNTEKDTPTTLTLSNAYGTYSIQVEGSDLTMPSILVKLVIPLLASCGYQEKTISDYIFSDGHTYEEEDDE